MPMLIVLVAAVLAQTDPASLDDALRRAKNEYAYGNYADAREHLRGLLYPMRLTTDAQVVEARKYLALSSYLLNRGDEAEQEFAKLLYVDPDYELDPFSVAPGVIEIFENIRKKLAPELNAIRERKKAPPPVTGVQRTIDRTVIEHSDIATFLPFGVGQFQNGDVGWGIFFASTQAVFLAMNMSSYFWAVSLGNYGSDKRSLAAGLAVVQYASLAAFGLAWGLSIFHARVHFMPTLIQPPIIHDEPLQSQASLHLAPGVLFTWTM